VTIWLAQTGEREREREREKGHFSFLIFNSRSSLPSPTRPTVWGFGVQRSTFNCPPIFPSLPLHRPPSQPLTGDGVLPSFFGVPYSSKILVGFRHPHFFFSIESRNLYPSPPALFNCSSPHLPPTLPLHMSFPQGHPDDAIPWSQYVTAHRREIPADEATGRLLNLPSLYSPVIS
jgi:hypothetical protein